jgi:hypothetical protein
MTGAVIPKAKRDPRDGDGDGKYSPGPGQPDATPVGAKADPSRNAPGDVRERVADLRDRLEKAKQKHAGPRDRLEIADESDPQSVDDAGRTLNEATPSAESAAVMKEYQSGAQPVNGVLRGEDEDADGAVAQTVSRLDAVLEETKTSKDVTTYRGQELTDAQVTQLNELAATGGTYVDAAFLSTTLSKTVAEDFIPNRKTRTGGLFEIEVPAGSSGAYVNRFSGNDVSDPIGGEVELLMPRNQPLRVVSVTKTADRRILVKLRAGR